MNSSGSSSVPTKGMNSILARRTILGVALATPPTILASVSTAQASTHSERATHIAENRANPECLADLMNGGA